MPGNSDETNLVLPGTRPLLAGRNSRARGHYTRTPKPPQHGTRSHRRGLNRTKMPSTVTRFAFANASTAIRQCCSTRLRKDSALGVGMDPSSKKIFVSYVEEDGDVAHEIAQHLEAHGYSSWYYERDCPAGADYFEETFKAISDCEAMVIVISPRSLPSDQITREIVRAVESSKATFPLLLEVTHDDYAHRRPGWHQAMAAANATRIPPERVATVVPSLVAGLGAKGIQASANGRLATAAPAKQTTAVPQAILNAQLS